MSRRATACLFFGLGVLLSPVVAIAGALIGGRLHEEHMARADELRSGWWR